MGKGYLKMGKEFIVTSWDEMCDLMCGGPEKEEDEEGMENIVIEIVDWDRKGTYGLRGPKEFHEAFGQVVKTNNVRLYSEMWNISNWANNVLGRGVCFTIA